MSSEKNKTICIVQARMASTRLPGKILLKICDTPVLAHVLERLALAREIDQIIIATTQNSQDDLIAQFCQKQCVPFYRGSETDVLARYFEAAEIFQGQIIVRVTSDCPLIDPLVIDQMLRLFKENHGSVMSNVGLKASERTFPRGLDTEIFSYEILKEAFLNAKETYQREHVTPYMYEHIKNIQNFKNPIDLSTLRLTLDTVEDFNLINAVYEKLYRGEHDFFLKEIAALFAEHPELEKLNRQVRQKELK